MMCSTMAGHLATRHNLFNNYRQIIFLSIDEQLLVLWVISKAFNIFQVDQYFTTKDYFMQVKVPGTAPY